MFSSLLLENKVRPAKVQEGFRECAHLTLPTPDTRQREGGAFRDTIEV